MDEDKIVQRTINPVDWNWKDLKNGIVFTDLVNWPQKP